MADLHARPQDLCDVGGIVRAEMPADTRIACVHIDSSESSTPVPNAQEGMDRLRHEVRFFSTDEEALAWLNLGSSEAAA